LAPHRDRQCSLALPGRGRAPAAASLAVSFFGKVRHIVNHIPGNPGVIVQNTPGGGRAAN
jgi:hypothetical protein